MDGPRSQSSAHDSGEQALLARDAYRNVTVLALLQLIGCVVYLTLVRSLPFWPYGAALVGLAMSAALALLYFVRTWKRPNRRAALRFSLVAVAIWMVIVAWTGWAHAVRGLPLELFATAELAMVSMALVAPGPFWLGVVLVALFQAELLGISMLARQLGLESLVLPGPLVAFALLGVGLLVVREQRRRRAVRHLAIRAEARALRELGPLFDSVRGEINRQLAALSEVLRSLHGELAPKSLARMDRVVDRMTELSGRLETLHDNERIMTTGESPATGSASVKGEHEAEHLFTARDAHDSALLGITLVTLMFLLYAENFHRFNLEFSAAVFIAGAVPPLIAVGHLVVSRRRPSERVALAVLVFFCLYSLSFVTWGVVQLFSLQRPLLLFAAYQVIVVTVPLVVATRFWVAIALVTLTGAIAIALYVLLHLGEHKDIVPLSEPWSTMLFVLLAVGLVMMREQRRIASVRLFRAEWELVALHRQAALFLALRDQLGTPLQSLVLYTFQLEQQSAAPQRIEPLRAAVDRLVALNEQLDDLETSFVAYQMHRASLDAKRELLHA